jgi:hypothetical protein
MLLETRICGLVTVGETIETVGNRCQWTGKEALD